MNKIIDALKLQTWEGKVPKDADSIFRVMYEKDGKHLAGLGNTVEEAITHFCSAWLRKQNE